jgi:hypothetical protein
MQIANLKLRREFNLFLSQKYDFDLDNMEFYGKPDIEQYGYYEEFFLRKGIDLYFIRVGENYNCHAEIEGIRPKSSLTKGLGNAKRMCFELAVDLWIENNS